MADKMMRIAGRGVDGLAKPLAMDNEGFLRDRLLRRGSGLIPISAPTLLTIPTYDGSGQAVHPSVEYFPRAWNGYKYWMAMTPYPGGVASYENPSIVASNDGVTWAEPAGLTNPIFPTPDTGNYSDPHLVFNFATNKLMLYWQHNGTGKYYKSDSADGITWSAAVEITGLYTSPSIVKTRTSGTQYVAFSPSNTGIVRSYSEDGLTFTHHAFVNIRHVGLAGHSWFGLDDTGWHGLINYSPPNRLWSDCNLYYAYSPNGWDWKLYPTPLLGGNEASASSYNAYRSCMVNLGDRWRVYYSTTTPANVWSIGYFDAVLDVSDFVYDKMSLPLFRNLEIRGAAGVASVVNPNDEWNNYAHHSIIFNNSHDKKLKLVLTSTFRGTLSLVTNNDVLYKYNATTPTQVFFDVAVGNGNTPVYISSAEFPVLDQKFPGGIMINAQRYDDPPPTTGALNATLLMWN